MRGGIWLFFKKFLIYIKNCSQCWIPRKVMIVLREGAKKGTREFYVYCAHKMLDLRAKHGISKQVQLSKIVDWLGLEFTTRSSFKSVIYQIHQNGMYQIFISGKNPWNYTKYKKPENKISSKILYLTLKSTMEKKASMEISLLFEFFNILDYKASKHIVLHHWSNNDNILLRTRPVIHWPHVN